jgi:hypothetical protein
VKNMTTAAIFDGDGTLIDLVDQRAWSGKKP